MTQNMMGREVYAEGQVIFREGDTGDKAYLIQYGEVALTKEHEGKLLHIATLGKNTLFGDMALIDSKPRMATATAIKTTLCIAMSKVRFQSELAVIDEHYRAPLETLMEYVRITLPWEERQKTDEGRKVSQDDVNIYRLITDMPKMEGYLSKHHRFLLTLYQMLITYAKNRLPPR